MSRIAKAIRNLASKFAKVLVEDDSGLPADKDEQPGAKASPVESTDLLCLRLARESRTQPDVRELYLEAFDGNNKMLADELICLMFNLNPPAGGFLDKWLGEALAGRSALKVHRNVFYIYVDRNFRAPDVRELSQGFYQRLLELAQEAKPLADLLQARFQIVATGSFDITNNQHRRIVRNLLSCSFSICRKNFPSRLRGRVYVVGRRPLHDALAIKQYQQEELDAQQESTSVLGSDQSINYDPRIYLAATIIADGKLNDNNVRLNAHRFVNFAGPMRENELYIGTWLTDWELSVGAAEHDEIRCASFGDQSCKLIINNLHRQDRRWEYTPRLEPDTPIPGLKWYTTRRAEVLDNHIQVKVIKHGTVNKLLLDYISSQKFRQEVTVIARLLPLIGGSLDRFSEINEQLRRSRVGLSPVAAIEVRPAEFWLVRTTDDEVRRVFKRATAPWAHEVMEEGAWFELNGYSYLWSTATSEPYAHRYYGKLNITPPDDQKEFFNSQLTVDEESDGLLIAFDGTFSPAVNPDLMLGKGGVVSIKCVKVRADGRGEYAFVPVEGSSNPFFAVRPTLTSKDWPLPNNGWLVFTDEQNNGNLNKDSDSEVVAYNGKPIIATRGSYELICGSSAFQIKVSGTPPALAQQDDATEAAREVLTLAPPVTEIKEPLTQQPQEIIMRLLNTRWEDFEVNQLDQSNFAAHYALTKGKERYFLKAYFPASMDSAQRETDFYARYIERASELYLVPPEILRDDDDAPPWGIVFPRLIPLDDWPPKVSGQVKLAHAAAIGYGYAKLLRAMDEDGLINFDIDPTTICFKADGQMVIVDFDNVYPILTNPDNQDEQAPLIGILKSGVLPAKNPWLPPEALAFRDSSAYYRLNALKQIGPPFGTYMLAAVLLQLLNLGERSTENEDCITVPVGTFAPRAAIEGVSLEDAARFEQLLREMLEPKRGERPATPIVLERLAEVTRLFARSAEVSREITKILGALP